GVDRGEEVGERARFARGELCKTVHHAGGLVGRRGRRLVEHERAVAADEDEVRERAADVDADPVASGSARLLQRWSPRSARIWARSSGVASASTARSRSSTLPERTTP